MAELDFDKNFDKDKFLKTVFYLEDFNLKTFDKVFEVMKLFISDVELELLKARFEDKLTIEEMEYNLDIGNAQGKLYALYSRLRLNKQLVKWFKDGISAKEYRYYTTSPSIRVLDLNASMIGNLMRDNFFVLNDLKGLTRKELCLIPGINNGNVKKLISELSKHGIKVPLTPIDNWESKLASKIGYKEIDNVEDLLIKNCNELELKVIRYHFKYGFSLKDVAKKVGRAEIELELMVNTILTRLDFA